SLIQLSREIVFPRNPYEAFCPRYNSHVYRTADGLKPTRHPPLYRRQINKRLSHSGHLGLWHKLNHVLNLGARLCSNGGERIIKALVEGLLSVSHILSEDCEFVSRHLEGVEYSITDQAD